MVDWAGTEVAVVWRGRRVNAFVPTLIADRDLTIDAATSARTARAQSEIEFAAERLPTNMRGMARLLLRSEGVASSYIEGIIAPALEVVLAEQRPDDGTTPAAWVAANLAAVSEALDGAHDRKMSVELMCAWHRTLMAGSPLPQRHVGAIRDEQGWIGGANPFEAHLVTPPPAALRELLDDLVAFVNRDDVDPIAQAAIAHAQFEIVHPFADGNGRIGRILIAWSLTRRLALVTPPATSTAIAADVGGYSAGLTLFRCGQHGQWIRWFADSVAGAGRRQRELVDAVESLEREWRKRLGAERSGTRKLRSTATAWRVLDLLPAQLVLTSRTVGAALDVPTKTAGAALRELANLGVLVAVDGATGTRGRPESTYTSVELLGLVSSSPLRA
jgi:Fic family protein